MTDNETTEAGHGPKPRMRFEGDLGIGWVPPAYYMKLGPDVTLHLEGQIRASQPGIRGTVQPEGEPHRVQHGQWTVTVDGLGLGVSTSVAIETDDDATEIAREARRVGDRYLLASTLVSHVPMHIDWEGPFLLRHPGDDRLVGDVVRNYLEIVPVDPPPDRSFRVLCDSPALAEAALLFREAMIAEDEARPGLDLFLGLAVEHIIGVVMPTEVAQANAVGRWLAFEATHGATDLQAHRLYSSLQLGRHRDATRQRAWLRDNGHEPMSAAEKIDAVDGLLGMQLDRAAGR